MSDISRLTDEQLVNLIIGGKMQTNPALMKALTKDERERMKKILTDEQARRKSSK